jgi:hypothetical protein
LGLKQKAKGLTIAAFDSFSASVDPDLRLALAPTRAQLACQDQHRIQTIQVQRPEMLVENLQASGGHDRARGPISD